MSNFKFSKEIKIGNKIIGDNYPVFIIAEAGVNHNGDMSKAKKLIDVATASGVDAVKFQAFKTENLILENVEKAPYQKIQTGVSESQFEMLKKLEVTKEQNLELINYAKQKGIIFLSTPFDEESLEELEELNVEAFKISSTDITNLPLIKRAARKNRPLILSTGMSYMEEVKMAVNEIAPLNKNLIILQCTANYPVRANEVNLSIINTYKNEFDAIIGYSDHSVGIGAAPYSIPLGAKVVEKHFTLDKSDIGPDHEASLDPNELINFVKTIREVENYIGSSKKMPTEDEKHTRNSLQKCLVATKLINKGEVILEEMIVAKRTGGVGISPINYKKLVGEKAKRRFNKDDILEL
jgi:N-acetylneuraminate synthase